MTELHPLVAEHRRFTRYEAEVAKVEARHQAVQAKLRAAEQAHTDAVVRWQRTLDEGTAGPRPEYHPPGNASQLQHERAALRSQRSDVLATIAPEVTPALQAREGELLVQVSELVDALQPLQSELEQILRTARALAAAQGVPSGDTRIPSSVTLGELVELAERRASLLPTELVPTPDPAPAWTYDDGQPHPGRREAELATTRPHTRPRRR